MDDLALSQFLTKACPRPAYLASTDGGPALALALHCIMVNEGFVLSGDGVQSTTDPSARYVPQKEWNGMFLDQWIFTYTKPGKARRFTLHCSLQSRTKRMFIHCCEENNQNNVCVLGLQLENYVPHPEALRSNSWGPGPDGAAEGPVVRNVAKMYDLMSEHIIRPLLAAAEDEQAPPPPVVEELQQPADGARAGIGSNVFANPRTREYLAVAAVAGLAVFVAVLLINRPPRRMK